VPEQLAAWRRARAEVAHDWLERQLLPILQTPGVSPEDSSRRARLCLEAWQHEIHPRLQAALNPLPECLLPGLVLRGRLAAASVERLNLLSNEILVTGDVPLRMISAEIRNAAAGALRELEANALNPSDKQRRQAFEKVMTVRNLLHQLPRSIVLP
jgi:hypothetical protein